jgi:hypothetical protein
LFSVYVSNASFLLDCIDVVAPGEDIPAPTIGGIIGRGSESDSSRSSDSSSSSSSNSGSDNNNSSGNINSAVTVISGSSASAAIVTSLASLLFSAILRDPVAMKLLANTLNDDDISTFLRGAVIYSERSVKKEVHIDGLPQCSIGTRTTLLDMFYLSLHKLEDSLTLNHPSRPKAFNNLKSKFAKFTKNKNAKKYEE